MARKKSRQEKNPATEAPVQQADAAVAPVRGMPYSTAILAIVLAFVLGAIVGSLVPQALQPVAPAPVAENRAPAAAQQQAAQQPTSQQQGHDLHIVQDLEKKIAADPTNRQLFVQLGNACFDAHLHERAIQAYEKALEMDAKDADVLTDVGIMYRETGAFDTALARFRQAQAVDSRHINAVFNEGVVLYYDLKRKEEALACWQRILAANPAARAPNGRPLTELIKELQ